MDIVAGEWQPKYSGRLHERGLVNILAQSNIQQIFV